MNQTGRTVVITVLVFLALPLLWGAMMFGGMGPGMMWGGDGAEYWNRARILMMVPALLVTAGIVATLFWGVGRAEASAAPPAPPTASDILDARYVRGEITRDQYQQMKSDLRS